MERLGPGTVRLPGDAPREFMESRMNMPDGIAYSQEVDRFLPEQDAEQQRKEVQSSWEATHKDRESLFQAMEAFQDKLAKKDSSVAKIDLRSSTWPQVMKEFERAVSHYREKRLEGPLGKVNASFRKLGENADSFKDWLRLLPNGDYGSPICGAFQLALGAFGRLHKVRSDIYEALQDIPDAVSKAQRYLQVYNDVKAYKLSHKTAQLFSAVLNALETIIAFLTESGYKRAGKAFFKGDEYSAPITARIGKVKKLAFEINEEAKICAEYRARKTDQNVEIVKDMIKGMHQATQEAFQQAAQQAAARQAEVSDLYHRFFLAHPNINLHTRQPFPLPALENSPVPCRTELSIGTTAEVFSNDPQKAGVITISQLVSMLPHNQDLVLRDRNRCRFDGQGMSLSDKDRASHVARSERLQHWLLQTQTSSALFVLANIAQNTALFSPLSFLAAELAHIYAETDSTATLSFFCGLHTQSFKDPHANAIGMMMSFLGQLLSYKRFEAYFDLEFVDNEMLEGLVNGDLQSLCDVFRTLVLQIKEPTMLFAFIDTISIYETRQRLEETKFVVQMLKDLVEETKSRQTLPHEGEVNEDPGVAFKFLVTDPGHSCKIEQIFEADETYLVDEHIDGERQDVIDMQGLEG